MARKNRRKHLPKKAKDVAVAAVERAENAVGTFKTNTRAVVDGISKTFLIVVFVILAFIVLFSIILYKLIVLSPEPDALITVSLIILAIVVLALVIGAYKFFKWWIVSRFLKGLTDMM